LRVDQELRVPVHAVHLAARARLRDARRDHVPAGRTVVAVSQAYGMSVVLETRGLTKRFGAVRAADGLDVRVDEGTVVALIGGNGAGKTTFLNMVTGYLKPDRGTVHYAGRDITALPERRITQLGICRSFQIPQLFDSLSVRENLLVGFGVVALGGKRWASAAGIDPDRVEEAADEAIERYGLAEYRS